MTTRRKQPASTESSSAPSVDWRQPDYQPVLLWRADRLARMRADPDLLFGAKHYYRTEPWQFVAHWGMTFEPRNVELGGLPNVPFVPWERQIEYMQWICELWQRGERGLVEKSRDGGVTWLSVGLSVALWLFFPGFTGGFGSRKEDLVDRRGDPKSIFEKIRFFVRNIPKDFLPDGFSEREHSSHMKLLNPENGASLTGEAGDMIGRGGRASIYFVDEAAFIERQDSVDAALSMNTNCQIDISTPNGSGNAFYRKRLRFDKTHRLFVFDWRDDPRKDDAWYAKQVEEQDEVIVAQEIDRDYAASQEDSFIPAKWVAAAIDAHVRLGFDPSGLRVTGFDPADVGDAKAIANRYGSVILQAREKTKGDIRQAIPWAFHEADHFRADVMVYDGDGMGAPTMKLALEHRALSRMRVTAYHGSAGVLDPNGTYDHSSARRRLKRAEERTRELHEKENLRTNADSFANFRAQTWSWVRDRFELTHEAVTRAQQGMVVNADPEDLISISSKCEALTALQTELSRPMRIWTPNGKIQVESKPHMRARGISSPNLAEALVMACSIRTPTTEPKRKTRVREHKSLDRSMGY